MDWTEKYRPKIFDDIVGQEKIVNYYKSYKERCEWNEKERDYIDEIFKRENDYNIANNSHLEIANLILDYPKYFSDDILEKAQDMSGKPKPPHAIFRGRCGIGKTTTAKVIENEFNLAKPMTINGSQDRSLTYFREKVIPTMKVAPFSGNFRLIVVDEIESMLKEAWMVLKTPLENYQENVMVIFICNDDKGIPEAIYSRCKTWDFTPISREDIVSRLRYIADNEQVDVTDDVLKTISEKAKNDLRKAINLFEDYSKKALQFGKDEFSDMFVLTG